MAHKIKDIRISQVLGKLKIADSAASSSVTRTAFLRHNKNKNDIEMHFGLSASVNLDDLRQIPESEIRQKSKSTELVVTLPKKAFISDVINSITSRPSTFWQESPFTRDIPKQKVLVEFSSPNIAKPFHMGHFRSTIIGNFISNLMASLGHDVVKLNFLGDWGTQFGLLNLGLELNGVTDEEIARDPIRVLYESYVLANKEAESDPSLLQRARQIFNSMEEGDFGEKGRWERIRHHTVEELRQTYLRLGVTFDEYQWESMFRAKEVEAIIQELDSAGILETLPDGKRVVRMNENRTVTLVKSDGSTLYLTRDVAAAQYRYNKHNFNRLLYVVENGQGDHFTALKHILGKLGLPWSYGITHVKFGRIHGMSTRKGDAVFLKDILDEACERASQRQESSKNTRISVGDESADALGLSAVIINDLKQRRQRDYTFEWEKALQMQGDGGIKLQYTHCRLCTLDEKFSSLPVAECDGSHLTDPIATSLTTELGRFDEVLSASYSELESCILVNYLFSLCNNISQAFLHLRVKDQPPEVAVQRLLLFNAAKTVLGTGMKILGIEPLRKM